MRSGIAVAALWLAAFGCTGKIYSPAVGAGGESTGGATGIQPTGGVSTPGAGGGGAGSSGTTPVGGAPGTNPTADCTPVPTRIWKLSDSQYQKAITDLLPSVQTPAVQTPGRSRFAFADFADELPVSGAMATVYRQTAKTVAAKAVSATNNVIACKTGEAMETCAGRFIDELAPRAWRRPITPEDRTALLAVYQTGSPDGFTTGIRLVLEAILQSPSFLYRTELGAPGAAGDKVPMTPYELASSLSFLLLDSIPDDQLWSHAKDGTIADDAVWKAEVDRLLQIPRVRDNLVQVLVRWLAAEQVLVAEGDTTAFPGFDSLREDMLEETRTFLGGLLAGQGTISDLLTSRSTRISPALAAVYGVTLSGTNVQTVMLPAAQRSGILTQAGIIAGWAKDNRSVHRGLFVFRELLCGLVPSPPAGLDTSLPPGITTERQFAEYRAANSCRACHANFDPIGLSYENYDPFGRYITERDGAPVDSRGTINLDGASRDYANVVEIGTLLSQSQQVKACVAEKLTVYAFGRRASATDACIGEGVERTTTPIGSKLVDLFKAITESGAFRNRKTSS